MPISIFPTDLFFRPDSRRVVVQLFYSKDPLRLEHLIRRALAFSEVETNQQLESVRADFSERHRHLDRSWLRHFESIRSFVPQEATLSEARRLFLGALVSGEYALESAALFNPSIVPHPDQSGLADGDLRFIMSLRATGEGHISSIEFRTGILRANHAAEIEDTTPFVTLPELNPNPTFHKATFLYKLQEMGLENDWSRFVMEPLARTFTLSDLENAQAAAHESLPHFQEADRTRECMSWLAESNYEIYFNARTHVSERVIFPVSANESNGIEDARFVRFVEEDGSVTYYATYTAYNGRMILPQLIQTTDFLHFQILTLNGRAAQNKGMALFPRRVNGRFAMLSRQDDENLLLMFSDNLHFWSDPQILQTPLQPWELVKIGNCGSPIETEAGWLVITHGVGPMRKYCIGAILLKLDDPSQVIGRLEQPLLVPEGSAREGYVPNVVYSCGALVHEGRLVLPYGMSDSVATIVTVDLKELLSEMVA